ncbi:MAG: MBL fold metallo-hydrolase, partial [Pseudorhodoplanes sp.]|nr:MBL fold metallo-hydrolase [Pseudorhodoplanes sp.]
MTAPMSVRFWGVRGSVPCPGPKTVRYGGNTPCVEVRCGEKLVIFDAGTGLRELGDMLAAGGEPVDA